MAFRFSYEWHCHLFCLGEFGFPGTSEEAVARCPASLPVVRNCWVF
jgi:hypothetical protein